MAEAFVLIFLQPAYITVMSVFLLKERVGYRRWSAVAIGFLGDNVGRLQAPAAYNGPTQYSQMIWAVVLGYVLFDDQVDLPMIAGIVLIVASGLLTLIRENVRGTPLPPSIAGERHVAAALVPEAGNPRH